MTMQERYPSRVQGTDVNGRTLVLAGTVTPLAQLICTGLQPLPGIAFPRVEPACPYCGHGTLRHKEGPAGGWTCPRCDAESA